MSDDRLLKLIQKLSDLTAKNRVAWKEAEQGEAFLASFSGHSVSIAVRQSRLDGNQSEYFIRILDQWGDTVEEVGDENYEDQQVFEQMKQLFEKARRIAKGVDVALDEIFRALDEADDLPF
jgi:hypothetical protein